LEFTRLKRQEDSAAVDERHEQRHEELTDLLVQIGNGVVNLTTTVDSHINSNTATAHHQGQVLAEVARGQKRPLAAVPPLQPAPDLRAGRTVKKLRRPGAPLEPDVSLALARDADEEYGGRHKVKHEILYATAMEPELLSKRLVSKALWKQLTEMVSLLHVSEGSPGLFGSYVIKKVHDLASEEAAAASRNGVAVPKLNSAKRTAINNVVTNKADVYIRQLSWLHGVVPRIMETPAAEATAEKMSTFKFTDDERKAIDEAVTAAAILAKVDIEDRIYSPNTARTSGLRDVLCTLAVDHDLPSNVGHMLRSPPFEERMKEAKARIYGRYEVSPAPQPRAAS